MNGSMCWFEVGHCFLSVVAVNGTTTNCSGPKFALVSTNVDTMEMLTLWTLILVSTNVDTILYLYLRLLTLLVLHHTRSSITIEVISRDSYCFPTCFFVSFSVYFSV